MLKLVVSPGEDHGRANIVTQDGERIVTDIADEYARLFVELINNHEDVLNFLGTVSGFGERINKNYVYDEDGPEKITFRDTGEVISGKAALIISELLKLNMAFGKAADNLLTKYKT